MDNLPNVLSNLILAQKNFDSKAYAANFSDTAIVFDENKTHIGKQEIMKWNEQSNEKYQTQLDPISYNSDEKVSVLTTKVSGNFNGSPIVLNYNFEIIDGLIQSLKITG